MIEYLKSLWSIAYILWRDIKTDAKEINEYAAELRRRAKEGK